MSDTSAPEHGLDHPAATFGTPEAVLADRRLGPAEKRAILLAWRQRPEADEAPALVDEEPNLALRLFRALSFLDTEDGSHRASHDQGFYTSIGDIRADKD